ncbi:MAG: gamma-glutamyl-gamma-aminobutyrate hydrolase family protein [Sedimentisphaerales bacterium]|jgi:GMP synthase (glutamine-hydrolysing)
MTPPLRFLIIDGYPKHSRDELEQAGMKLAWKLFADMLLQHLPQAVYDVLLPSDPGVDMPSAKDLHGYAGIIWTGCNLTIYDTSNRSVLGQIELAKNSYEIGVPSFGSCWGIQMAAFAAGGQVEANPKGREMGMGRKTHQTPAAYDHPMFEGKPRVFEGFVSHDDMVTKLPPDGVMLACNSFALIQAVAVTHKNGTFWATQYHCEYDLREMARLIVAREKKLIAAGFFRSRDDLMELVDRMEALYREPDRKDLRWQLAIDDDVLSDSIRQCEFVNWLKKLVLPTAGCI